jgi:hypothetical protein
MIKLDSEGHADYNVLYSNYNTLNPEMNSQKSSEEDDEEEDEDEDEEYESDADTLVDVETENNSLKLQVLNLEKKVNELSEFIMKQNKGGSVFSLF